MLAHTSKSLLVACSCGFVAYSVWHTLGAVAWYVFPESPDWIHSLWEKLCGWFFTFLVGFIAARMHRPSISWAVATSIAAALVVQLLAAGLFMLRFGRQQYATNHTFWPTLFITVTLGLLVGLLAARRYSKHASSPV